LAEFASVVDAVRCAIELQRQMALRNDDVPNERRIQFRIGINVGDIIIEADDIYGDGVNVAARLEAMAAPGGICISAIAYDQVQGRLECAFADLGEQSLKNITRPTESTASNRKLRRRRGRVLSAQRWRCRTAVHCGAPVPEHLRRPRAGIFRRRHGRGDHHRPEPHPLALRDRA
jgi:class 3 adenylate cyclase